MKGKMERGKGCGRVAVGAGDKRWEGKWKRRKKNGEKEKENEGERRKAPVRSWELGREGENGMGKLEEKNERKKGKGKGMGEKREQERAWRWVFSAVGNLGRKKEAGDWVGERGERKKGKKN